MRSTNTQSGLRPGSLIHVTLVVILCCLEVYGQRAFLLSPPGPVSEASGSVSVCVNVTNADSIPNGGATIEVFTAAVGLNQATLGADYYLNQPNITFMPGTSQNCTSFTLIDDMLVEGNTPETIVVRIRSPDPFISIDTVSDIVSIVIEDNDRLMIRFTQDSYSVQEDFGSFELCTRITSGQIAPELDPVTIDLSVVGGTAQNNEDFMVNSSANYVFSNTTPTMACIPVTIIDDRFVEDNETFSVQLSVINDFVDISPSGSIIIVDDDFATVTIDPQQLAITEGNDTMNTTRELCAILSDIKDGLRREVTVNINATEYTATASDDFALLSNSVAFQSNARVNDTACFEILIIGDNVIETDEIFYVNLSTTFPDRLGDPSFSRVTVSHDGDVLCAILQAPQNGDVSMTGNMVGSIASYSCVMNYELVGAAIRNCTANFGWSSQDPLCLRQCDSLDIDNGNVVTNVGQNVEGAIATYTCESGYRLNNNLERVCQGNGQWNGSDPICQEINCGELNDPQYGRVSFDNTLLGAFATYSCDNGFMLEGSPTRMCGSDGLWVGDPPICSGAVPVTYASGMLLAITVFVVMLSAHLLS